MQRHPVTAGDARHALLSPERLCPQLAQDAVQVWVLHDRDVAQICSALGHTLSPQELARASAYKREPHRARFIARRSMLRWLSARYLACSPEALCLSFDGLGKPAWQRPTAPRLAFSVSQTESMALLAFAWDCQVGVDVEQLMDGVDFAGVAQAVFSSAEKKALQAARLDPAAAFFSIWTRKEALLKAMGTGLSPQSRNYTTQDALQQCQGRWRACRNGLPLTGWTLLDLAAGPGVKAALAVSCRDAQVSLRHCPLAWG